MSKAPVAPIYQYTNGRLIKPWLKGYPINNRKMLPIAVRCISRSTHNAYLSTISSGAVIRALIFGNIIGYDSPF